MLAAVRIFFADSSKQLSCFAHTINLVAAKVIEEEEVSNMIKKVRKIVKYFKKSVIASDQLKAAQEDEVKLKLILDVKTRWNSCFYMLERFLKLSSVVSALLLKDINAPPMVLACELNEIKELMTLLKPLEYITKDISGQYYVTASRIIPIVNCLLCKISALKLVSPLCIRAQLCLQKSIKERFGDVENDDILSVCTILDPRFKCIHFKNSSALSTALYRIKTLTEHQSQTDLPASKTHHTEIVEDDFWYEHKQLAENTSTSANSDSELTLYIKQPLTQLSSNPLTSWEDLKQSFPNLYALFQSHAMIVASSVPSERLFSKAGAIITEKRNRLSPEHLNKLLFLNGCSEEQWENAENV